MEEMLRSNLIELATAFESATNATRATIGKRALNDNTFYARVESGAGFNIKTFDRLLQWFSDNWPEGVDWPAHIDRPFPVAGGRAKTEAAA